MRRSLAVSLLLALAALFGLGQFGPDTAVRGPKRFERRVVAERLGGPWEVTWGPDAMLWVTERSARRVTRVNPTSGAQSVAVTIADALAPGGQDGVLGMALHPELLKGSGKDFVYVAYTYADRAKGPVLTVTDPQSPYRYLYLKIMRFTYRASEGKLGDPVEVLKGLPAGNDHVGGRLKFGPDAKLYLTIGDQGHNQLGNFCLPIEAQRLPTQAEVDRRDYSPYVGKTLRIGLDGSIPADNPRIGGVVSHVFTYGHRNPQGIDFAADGTLYESEQGPKTDDEVNVLRAGGNYGWPHIAGFRDDKAYVYARWASAKTPCSELKFSDLAIDPSVPRETESAYTKPFVEPLATLFTVPSDHKFTDATCRGIDFMCWPTVAASSIEHYQPAPGKGIPGWDRVLMVTALKRGSLFVVPLDAGGKRAAGPVWRYFQQENRLRDTAVSPDGMTIYIATDASGVVESRGGGVATRMENPGAILAYTYAGEGSGEAEVPATVSGAREQQTAPVVEGGVPAQFTAAQANAGKTAYNANCAVCHGNTLTNGTMGTPLAGDYFQNRWRGRSVGALYDRAWKTMPPARPASLPRDTYSNIVAYILQVNGAKTGASPLPSGGEALHRMVVK